MAHMIECQAMIAVKWYLSNNLIVMRGIKCVPPRDVWISASGGSRSPCQDTSPILPANTTLVTPLIIRHSEKKNGWFNSWTFLTFLYGRLDIDLLYRPSPGGVTSPKRRWLLCSECCVFLQRVRIARKADRCNSTSWLSVRLSVCPSVRLSVTFRLLEIRQYFLQRKCRPKNLVFSNISFKTILAGDR